MAPTTLLLALPAWVADVLVPSLRCTTDEAKVALAITLSRRNIDAGTGGPFGAVVFGPDDDVVAVGVNTVLSQSTSLAHAETMALMSAQRHLGRPRLNREANDRPTGPFTLAASSQPCCMCYGATIWAGIDRLVIGARSDDVMALTPFDEGPLPTNWIGELERRGVTVARDVCREAACEVLRAYTAAGGARVLTTTVRPARRFRVGSSRLMRFVALFAASVFCLLPRPLDARQDLPRPDRNANYALTARLDPNTRTITGTGRLEWRNRTATPATELRFHLYWNAWRDTHSTWMRGIALAGDTHLASRPESDRSAIDLTALRLVGGAATPQIDLLPRLRFMAPDDGNPRDRTLMSVALDEPLAPGATVSVEFAWTGRVPRPFARTGVIGSDYVIAHWFPKIGVLEDDGWKASQFHSHTEFFADFGRYDVRLTVPSTWVLGATGREASREVHSDGTTTHRYTADNVHDFAWATSPDYREHTARFEEPGLSPVDLRLLLRPEHAAQAERHLTAAREALKHLGRRLGPFPWSHLTIVDPVTIINGRAQGESTAGMEYPTLITAGTSWSNRWVDFSLEDVIAHEITHQVLPVGGGQRRSPARLAR